MTGSILFLVGAYYQEFNTTQIKSNDQSEIAIYNIDIKTEATPTTTSTPTPSPIPQAYVIPQRKHMYQTFNNCGPASLSMQLSYYNIDVSQNVLGDYLRPLQNPQGNNDDKSVSLEELGNYAEENYSLTAYQRPGGNIEMLKQFISNDIPVVLRTWLNPGEDIGHYRLVRGFDDSRGVIIQDDSYQGDDITFTYEELDEIWMPFSWEFLVLADDSQITLVENILGDNLVLEQAWQNSLQRTTSSQNQYLRGYVLFNRSRANHYLGNYEQTVSLYEQAVPSLPARMLWYQYEPIKAYLEIGGYQKVFTLTSQILNNNNLAYSELYILRGKAYERQGNFSQAREEFEKAVLYNQNLEEPKKLLENL